MMKQKMREYYKYGVRSSVYRVMPDSVITRLRKRYDRLAKSIAKELGSRGVRANAIAPGFIITDMTAALSDEVKAEWAKQIPLRRGGTPEDVANVATFLASDLSSYVTGQVIHCCGGMNM